MSIELGTVLADNNRLDGIKRRAAKRVEYLVPWRIYILVSAVFLFKKILQIKKIFLPDLMLEYIAPCHKIIDTSSQIVYL